MARGSRALFLVFFVTLTVLGGGWARAVPGDPAARGLDVYVHTAPKAASGGVLDLSLRAYGFGAVTQATPLAGATFEVSWDPEKLDGAAPPPSITATADAEGRATLAVPVPSGPPLPLELLVAVRHGGHDRVRSFAIDRASAATVELLTADTRVVPTSTISAWVHALGMTGDPLADSPVKVSLLEGGVARFTQTLRTDLGGLVMARVPIPRISEPTWSWTLRAEVEVPGAQPSELTLTPREESPGTPTLEATWMEPTGGATAGARVPFALRLRDATGQPIIEHEIRYWIGARGTTIPPKDADWARQSTVAKTDGAGEFRAFRDAPTLVKPGGTELQLVARVAIEGQALEKRVLLGVGVTSERVTVVSEAGKLVPGLAQRIFVHAERSPGEPLTGAFAVSADGLAGSVTTDAHGDGELTWNVPAGVGASRQAGPCAGDVAAAVTLRGAGRTLVDCVSVDREAPGVVRVTPDLARPGERVQVVLAPAAGAKPALHSVVAMLHGGSQAITGWLSPARDGTSVGDLVLPASASPGLWDLSVALADGTRDAHTVTGRLLVTPRSLPLLTVKRTGGRATPGGAVEVEAQLTDGHGHGLPGAVSAVVIDAFGGGRADVDALDTRKRLCDQASFDASRCTAALEREPATDVHRHAALAPRSTELIDPRSDPAKRAKDEFRHAFSDVMHSLEGAVYESTSDPQRLVDARRKEGGRWVFNPELLTLATSALDPSPVTPGGEALTLPDLIAFDPQVTFDNVARRVTRLKLFSVISAVRAVRTRRQLDLDEPLFKDPNALLRRLVRDSELKDTDLLDPWGGTLQYVTSNAAPPAPFLGTVPAHELRSPGPDGVLGTADDVRDPFARVVRSGSPYAEAMGEDRIVDAKWDMVVSEDTMSAWKQMFEELTGRQLGEGIGLGGVGSGGGGSSLREGSTSTGYGRGTSGVANGDAFWTPPLRTDGEGRVRFTVPLGAAETTWRVAFVGVPDRLLPATAELSVASDLPLSLRADTGARWTTGDVVATPVLVRNRTSAPLVVRVEARAEGGAALVDPGPRTVTVPAGSAREVQWRVRAASEGEGRLVLLAHAAGVADDVLRHTWQIAPAGEERAITQTGWVEHDADLAITLEPGYALHGAPRLVLERGFAEALAAALGALDPDNQASSRALLDTLDAANRIERWATTQTSARDRAIADQAGRTASRALGRYHVMEPLDKASSSAAGPAGWTRRARALSLAQLTNHEPLTTLEQCPPEWNVVRSSALDRLRRADDDEVLDVEPAEDHATTPCWSAYVATATAALHGEVDPELVARALLALADRPEHVAVTTSLALHLRRLVALDRQGQIDLPASSAGDLAARARQATIYAALLRTQHLGGSPATAPALFGKLARLRDVHGGYGSSGATLAVVRALLSSQLGGRGASRVHVRGRGIDRVLDVAPDASATLPLPPGTTAVSVEVEGPPLVARLERPILRSWTRVPPPQASPVGLEVIWPAEVRAGQTGTLRLVLRQSSSSGGALVDARLPLPPGVTYAGQTGGAIAIRQIQGVLFVRQTVPITGSLLEIPVRFGLAGETSAAEATAQLAQSGSGVAVAPARLVTVR